MLANEVRHHIRPPLLWARTYLVRFLQGARLREKSLKQEVGDDVSEFSDDESDIAEELGYISPLDTVDPYVSFKQALTSTCHRWCQGALLLTFSQVSR